MIVEHVVRRGSARNSLGDDDDDIDDGSSYIISATALILLYVRLDYSVHHTPHHQRNGQTAIHHPSTDCNNCKSALVCVSCSSRGIVCAKSVSKTGDDGTTDTHCSIRS